MAKDKANIRIYGGDDSAMYTGAVGTTFPIALAIPGVGWDDSGWLAEDGVSFERETDKAEVKAHQGGRVVRVKTTTTSETIKFQCLEETAITLGLAYPGATFTTTTGTTKIVPSGEASKEIAAISDEFDGTIHKRTNVIRGEIALDGEIVHKSGEGTVLEFALTVYEYEIYTNNPAADGS